MEKENAIKIFNDVKVRIHWDDENEKWYFAVVDVIAILTESENPQVYWRVLKKRLSDEGNETVTNCNTLKMPAADGKMRKNGSSIKTIWRSQNKSLTFKDEWFNL